MVARMRDSGDVRVGRTFLCDKLGDENTPVGEECPIDTSSGLGCRALAERLDCFFLAVIYLKNGEQFCDLQEVAYSLSQSGQLDCAAAVSRGDVQRDQRTQAAAINVSDFRQIQHDPAALRNQSSDTVAQFRGLLAENDSPGAIDYDNFIVKGANMNLQFHGDPL